MHELDHSKHRYEGDPGEPVSITITANNTSHLVTYVLDGAPARVLPEGESLQFNLKNTSGDVTLLQLMMDFNGDGSYDIAVKNVADCQAGSPPPTCTHSRSGPPMVIENYRFFVK